MRKLTRSASRDKLRLGGVKKVTKASRSAKGTTPPKVSAVRKNMYIRQDSLDEARAALGAKTETETVDRALGLARELAAFRKAMLAGFDSFVGSRLGLQHTDDELDFSGFSKPVPAATA